MCPCTEDFHMNFMKNVFLDLNVLIIHPHFCLTLLHTKSTWLENFPLSHIWMPRSLRHSFLSIWSSASGVRYSVEFFSSSFHPYLRTSNSWKLLTGLIILVSSVGMQEFCHNVPVAEISKTCYS